MNKGKNLQDVYLNVARKEKIDVTIYLMNGVPLNGKVISFDNFTILFEQDRKHNLVYKHAVSTVVPSKPIVLKDEDEK